MIDSFDTLPALPTTTGTAKKSPPAKERRTKATTRPTPTQTPGKPAASGRVPRRFIPRDPDQAAMRIAEAAVDAWHSGFGGSRREVALGAVATLTMIGQRDERGPDLAGQIMALPGDKALAEWMHQVWSLAWINRPDLITRARPLFDWLEQEPSDHILGCVRSVVEACLRTGILELCGTDRRFDTDMLGVFYQVLYSKKSRDGRGQFFTPSSVSRLLAEVTIGHSTSIQPGERFLEPAAGTGGMFRASAEILRERGMEPADMYWYANDIDREVAACCAVNMITWRMGPRVVVGCGDTLAEGNELFVRAKQEARDAYAARDRALSTAADIARLRSAARAFDALLAGPDAPDPGAADPGQ